MRTRLQCRDVRFRNLIHRSQLGNFSEGSSLQQNLPLMLHKRYRMLDWDQTDDLYLPSPVHSLMVSLPGLSDRSCRCTSICLQIGTAMCSVTRSRFRISFGMISRLATGTRLGLSISTLIYPRCALSLAVASGALTCVNARACNIMGHCGRTFSWLRTMLRQTHTHRITTPFWCTTLVNVCNLSL